MPITLKRFEIWTSNLVNLCILLIVIIVEQLVLMTSLMTSSSLKKTPKLKIAIAYTFVAHLLKKRTRQLEKHVKISQNLKNVCLLFKICPFWPQNQILREKTSEKDASNVFLGQLEPLKTPERIITCQNQDFGQYVRLTVCLSVCLCVCLFVTL